MKTIAIALLLFTAAAYGADGGSAAKEDSALVKAAKASRTKKKKATRKVITNADVKKSRGKLTLLPGKSEHHDPAATPAPAKSEIVQFEEKRSATEAANKRVADAEATVKSLAAELARIEQNYYETNDPNYRDTTIKERFEQTKRQLEDARKALAEARDAQRQVTATTPPKTP